MPNYTTNYNLKKPLQEEFYNIDDHNGNMDIIDGMLKVLSEDSGVVISPDEPETGDVWIDTDDDGESNEVGAYSKTEIDELLKGKASTSHSHNEYAASEHKHSTDDLTSGILPVERGGTGVASISALGTAIGACRIQTGSYTGTAAYGKSYPNTLTFNFPPKFVIITDGYSGSSNYDGRTAFSYGDKFFDDTSGLGAFTTDKKNHLTWSGNTVSWYYSNANDETNNGSDSTANSVAMHQLNVKSRQYYWVAIG